MQYYLRAGALAGYIELVEELGGDPIALLNAANIIPAQLNNPDNMILYSHFGDLLELTADHFDLPTFGTALSFKQNITTVGLIGAYMCQQPTIGDALQVAQKYTYMHAQGAIFDLQLSANGSCEISLELLVNRYHSYPQLIQLSVGLFYRIIADLAGGHWKPDKLCFRQSAPNNQQKNDFSRYTVKTLFDQATDGLHFSSNVLNRKPAMPQNLVKDIVAKQFNQQPLSPEIDNTAIVCHAINMLLPTGDCSKENVALSLGVHPKKLERMLTGHHTSYRALLEETRKDIATRMLQLNDMSMTALALNLGYSEFSAFSRSFKTWFGMPPSQYRSEQQH
ncbi:AraC family transcriptional regulator ligand-binding domain-containing protein [Colwellia sp. MEBiC06753]